MKKTTAITCLIVVAALVLCFHPSYLYTETASPSAASTGAPGEQTCNQLGCHAGNPINLEPGKLTLGAAGTPSIANGYSPNTTYSLFVNLSSNTPQYGFQITALDQNNNRAGTFILTDVNHTSLTTSGNKQYVGHKNANSTAAWSFNWQAPATDIGAITFYIVGCGADNNSQSTGDVIYQGRATVTTSSFSQLNLTSMKPINADEIQSLKVFPNPFRDRLNLEYFLRGESLVKMELFDMGGKLIKEMNECTDVPGFHQRSFELQEDEPCGFYLLKISEGEKIYFKKLMRN